jgi:pyridoxamine 5'-phosphate oxidase family protein
VLFTEKERAYILERRVAFIATVSVDGQPDVAPVGLRFDGERFHVGGRGLPRTLKYRNVGSGSTRVAIAMEDRAPEGGPRGLKIHGTARIVSSAEGREAIEISPTRSWSWGIEEPTFRPDGGYVLHRGEAS